jgi:hypothetical protein
MNEKVQSKKTDPSRRIDAALLEMAQDGLVSPETAEKITMRILGKNFPGRESAR